MGDESSRVLSDMFGLSTKEFSDVIMTVAILLEARRFREMPEMLKKYIDAHQFSNHTILAIGFEAGILIGSQLRRDEAIRKITGSE